MMSGELTVLCATAASIGLVHTLFGPDHYLPFVVMAQARRWSILKTTLITLACGIGHVGSSVALGTIGIAAGLTVAKLEVFEGFRGGIAAWLLMGFGFVYFVWGLRRAIRNRPHTHLHAHTAGSAHSHEHTHGDRHLHPHTDGGKSITPWALFTIFVFGPCEPLIPILMYPAATEAMWGVALVTGIFAAVTIGTMLAVVLVWAFGLSLLPTRRLERYSHALAGAAILLCGASIQFLGL